MTSNERVVKVDAAVRKDLVEVATGDAPAHLLERPGYLIASESQTDEGAPFRRPQGASSQKSEDAALGREPGGGRALPAHASETEECDPCHGLRGTYSQQSEDDTLECWQDDEPTCAEGVDGVFDFPGIQMSAGGYGTGSLTCVTRA